MKYDITISDSIGGWGITGDYIRYMLKDKKDKRVDVAICSLGGYVDAGMDIYQQFKDHGDVHCHFVGMSASAATFLAMGAKEIDMDKNALILIHNASQMFDIWANYNKESIDKLIEELGKTRQELETFDNTIAQIYADRCKKDIEVIKQQMTSNSWITAKKALELGLIDSIRKEDVQDTKQNVWFQGRINPTNEILNSLGLPALPEDSDRRSNTEDHNLLYRIAQKLGLLKDETLLPNPSNPEDKMLKVFNTVAALLMVEGFATDKEDKVTLDQQQMKTIDEALKQKETKIADLEQQVKDLQNAEPQSKQEDLDKINDLQSQLTQAQNDLKAKDEQIENLQKAPADETHEAPATEANEATGQEFVNFFK